MGNLGRVAGANSRSCAVQKQEQFYNWGPISIHEKDRLKWAENSGCLMFGRVHGDFVCTLPVMVSEPSCLTFCEFLPDRKRAWRGCEHQVPAVRGSFSLFQKGRKISPLNV